MNRREALRAMGNGFGMLGLASVLGSEASAGSLDPRPPHFPAKAKRVIFIFLNGGPSQVDTFDPKPMLTKYHNTEMPGENRKAGREPRTLLKSPFEFRKYGQSGIEVSDLFQQVAECIDDVCVIRSMRTDLPAHPQAILQMNVGHIIPGFPSM